MHRPQTVGKLMQFVQAVNWLWMPLHRLTEVVDPLRVLLEAHMGGIQSRSKRVASNEATVEVAWRLEQVAAWSKSGRQRHRFVAPERQILRRECVQR